MSEAPSEYGTHLPTTTLIHGHGGLLQMLHRDILFQILVRLGAKSRGKLSCVSKCFRSISTDPSFAEFQRNWSAARNHGTTILFSIQTWFMPVHDHPLIRCPVSNPMSEQFYTIIYEQNQAGKLLQAKIVCNSNKGWFQYGSCVSFAKDQTCFFNKHSEWIVVNLITGQHTTLPPTPSSSRHSCALLGYDGVSGTYKVLKAETKRTVKYWVFTLGVDEMWRRIRSPLLFYIIRYFTNSVCIDGVIYSYNEMSSPGRCSKLVAFDIRSESFHSIALPATYESFGRTSWVELDGRFAVMYVHQNKQVIAWSLETAAKSPSSWKKQAFPFPSEASSVPQTFITATPAGEIVLLVLKGTLSLWVLLDKFGTNPIWKEFRVRGLADFTPRICKSSKVAFAQNIAGNLLQLE
ncbi:unnamed protein product [Cuscuta epithymum]|uniref:F-box domain-containing protein n=1 Tax=Cuscuta epithymum TaxID=186058 RepID=A0AAV0EV22_9ASTE|nr:unnamed protein product [Cuscuta epithymum]